MKRGEEARKGKGKGAREGKIKKRSEGKKGGGSKVSGEGSGGDVRWKRREGKREEWERCGKGCGSRVSEGSR